VGKNCLVRLEEIRNPRPEDEEEGMPIKPNQTQSNLEMIVLSPMAGAGV
jgi:hypothetical protein